MLGTLQQKQITKTRPSNKNSYTYQISSNRVNDTGQGYGNHF